MAVKCPVKCFMISSLERSALYLRRYTKAKGWTCQEGYHYAFKYVGDVDDPIDQITHCHTFTGDGVNYKKDDPLWPVKCAKCDYAFLDTDYWGLFPDGLWHDSKGMVYTLRNNQPEFLQCGIVPVPPGAMYDAFWHAVKGPDGLALTVILPDGKEWFIDGRASNCTDPDESEHRCWVRHGLPPNITVDKKGSTCRAGAGSIQTVSWHGFLRDGELVLC